MMIGFKLKLFSNSRLTAHDSTTGLDLVNCACTLHEKWAMQQVLLNQGRLGLQSNALPTELFPAQKYSFGGPRMKMRTLSQKKDTTPQETPHHSFMEKFLIGG